MLEFLRTNAWQIADIYIGGMFICGLGLIVAFYFAYKEALKSSEQQSPEMKLIVDIAWGIAFAWMLFLWPYYALKAIFLIASTKGGEEE